METKTRNCDQCEAIHIQGILCHETGCPEAWRGKIRECDWCGQDFIPEESDQRFCDHSCFCSYHGIDDESEPYQDNLCSDTLTEVLESIARGEPL